MTGQQGWVQMSVQPQHGRCTEPWGRAWGRSFIQLKLQDRPRSEHHPCPGAGPAQAQQTRQQSGVPRVFPHPVDLKTKAISSPTVVSPAPTSCLLTWSLLYLALL